MAGVQHLRELCRQKRWSEDEARVVLSEARKSALALCTFAERHGLAPQRLYHWARRLEPCDFESSPARPAFQEIVVGARDSRVEIELRCGRIVRVGMDLDPAKLRALLNVVEAC